MQHGPVDVAIVTALMVEREAVLQHLDTFIPIQDDGEPLTYYRGHVAIPTTHERYEVVVIMLAGMGNDEAAVATTRLIHRWHPTSVVLIGIGAGVPGEVALGDVVVADFVYYYELAKVTTRGEQRRPQQFRCDRLLFDRARAYRSSEWQAAIGVARPAAPAAGGAPEVHFGAISSGEKVVADETTLAQLRAECPTMLALAMEGAGVARAVAHAPELLRFLEVRGICDFASPAKNDVWHGYAAHAAAAFMLGLLRMRPLPPIGRAEVPRPPPPVQERPGSATVSFGYWVRRQRRALDLTQHALAACVGCSAATIKKIEADARRPSRQMAARLAGCLRIADEERERFLQVVQRERAVDALPLPRPPVPAPAALPLPPPPPPHPPLNCGVGLF